MNRLTLPQPPRLGRRLPLPPLRPLRAAAWALALVSLVWAGQGVAAPLSGGQGWRDAPGVVFWYGGATPPRTRGNADAYCVEDAPCTAYGQGMAFSIEGGGSRVALPLVSTEMLGR
jgi:hypothetical protein